MKPYPFQLAITESLSKGNNVIVHAPTGSGKTKGALFYYLLAWDDDNAKSFPRKCIYSVPLKALANQFLSEYSILEKKLGKKRTMEVALQTGERSFDPQLEKDLIFTTIDQTLSNFLNIPYSLSNRKANINAGAVISSFLVFDEFHLFGGENALPTTIIMLKMLKNITPFVIMTATISQTFLSFLSEELQADTVVVSHEEIKKIPSQSKKERQFITCDKLLTAKEVLSRHKNVKRSIAICNTVNRAQTLYKDLEKLIENNIQIVLLHSRFLPEHRKEKEELILREFGKDKDKQSNMSFILVATQVIEVGLNITCENLYTEIAPISSILQRAGRCARFEDENGTVYVYQVPMRKDNVLNYAPYHNAQTNLCIKTWDVLCSNSGCVIDFHAERQIVEEIHRDYDINLINQIKSQSYNHQELIFQTIHHKDRSRARDLIRDIDNRSIIVHDKAPDIKSPFSYEYFQLHHSSVFAAMEEIFEWQKTFDLDWGVLRFEEQFDPEENSRGASCFQAVSVNSVDELRGAFLLAIHPKLATYDNQIGFRFCESGHFCSANKCENNMHFLRGEYSYTKETYEQHIRGLYQAYHQRLREDILYTIQKIENVYGYPQNHIEKAIYLCFAFHDIGKMTIGWQKWAHKWQELIGEPVAENVMLAHTCYNPACDHNKLQKKIKIRRPPHAVESARTAFDLLEKFFDFQIVNNTLCVKAAVNAIAHHHSSSSYQYQEYQFNNKCTTSLKKALTIVGQNLIISLDMLKAQQRGSIEDIAICPEKELEIILYFLFVRVLRLADQKSQTIH